MSTYAPADTKTQWFQDNYPGADLHLTADTMVVVVHTTEGLTWPGYNGGATAPNLTGLPPLRTRGGKWRQHFPDEKSSRALQNQSGGVETNTLNAFQIELIGTCDPKNRRSWNGEGRYLAGRDYVYWPDATDQQLHWVAALFADLHRRHGLRLVAPRRFKAYGGKDSSYGTNNGVRLSFAEWRKTVGVVGHQHVPENVHGDPGNIAMDKILAYANEILGLNGGATKPAPKPVKKLTSRGPKIEQAIKLLEESAGSGARGVLIKTALVALRKIKPIF